MDPPPQFYPDSHLSKGTFPRKRIHGQHSKSDHSTYSQRKPAMKRNTAPRGQQAYQPGSTQLFDDTSTVPQQHMQQGGFPGQNLINDPMVANMALQYGSSLASHGREYVDQHMNKWISVSKLKYYFAVDTSYVVKKLGLVMFPYTHQNWAVKYNKAEPVAPRYEINAPDLYIPVMAFVTFVLVAGLVLGTQNRFTPEQLGITASSALIWLFVELMAIYLCLYICSVSSEIKFLDFVAFCGYKYVGMIVSVLSGLLFGSLSYYLTLLWTCASTAFFLVRTLRLIILPEAADEIGRASKRRIYLLLFIAALQPFFMFFLTRHLAPVSTVVE